MTKKINNPKLKTNAQALRHNMTEEERRLWYTFLKPMGMNWYRQHVIGNYIVDFYCAKAKLVIELDGSQHYEDKALENDAKRDKYLTSLGFYVLRITNYDLHKNFARVCETIKNYMDSLPWIGG